MMSQRDSVVLCSLISAFVYCLSPPGAPCFFGCTLALVGPPVSIRSVAFQESIVKRIVTTRRARVPALAPTKPGRPVIACIDGGAGGAGCEFGGGGGFVGPAWTRSSQGNSPRLHG